jgi:glycerophosphoryl diester phosphodiesterase
MVDRMVFPRPNHPFFRRKRGRPLNIAHRGDSLNTPENTLIAFDMAIRKGADVIEVDVKLTSDNQLVLIHNERVDRISNARGRIRDYTLDELKRLDAGFRFSPDGGRTFPYRGAGITIPTLEEAISAFSGARFVLDLQSGGWDVVKHISAFLKEHKRRESILIVSEHSSHLHQLKKALPECAFGGSISQGANFWLKAEVSRPSRYVPVSDSIQLPNRWRSLELVSSNQVALARYWGLELHVFTVNSEDDMRRLVYMGVDGLITDNPGLLTYVLHGPYS